MQSEILAHQEEQGLRKELHEGGRSKKLLRAGTMAMTWRVHAVEMAPTGEVGIEETDCSGSRQEEHDVVVPCHGSMGRRLEVEEELSTLATQCWAEGVWTGIWHHEQETNSRSSDVETGESVLLEK